MSRSEEITIARVIARLNVGGPAIQAILMTDAFRQKGYRSLLITGEVAPGEASMEYLAAANDVSPIKIGSMSRHISLPRDIKTLWALIRIFRRENPTVVHTHTAKGGTLGRIAGILTGVPILVHTFHGHVFSGYFSPFITRIFLAIERLLARYTDRIVAISDSQRTELSEVYRVAPAEKIVTIPLGFDMDPFLESSSQDGSFRADLGVPRGQPLVGWVGRLTAIKSPASLIDCALLFKSHPLAPRFVMVGDGDLRDECEASIRQKALDGVVLLTGCRRDLPGVYANLDFVVATSLSEGTPVALLEAMASGKAVISTDVGGVRDLMVGAGRRLGHMELFENGILVSRDSAHLTDAIEYLMTRPSISQQMGHRGREFVRGRYSHLRLADDLCDLYQTLAKSKIFVKPAPAAHKEEVEATVAPGE